jgi:tRNA nucleotidyltransferase (CCA-adding enzyme)
MGDLKNKILNCVGSPGERFAEDALRIMRAVRFASVYGFEIGNDTKNGIFNNVGLLDKVSPERKRTELCGFLTGKNCKSLLLEFSPVFTAVIPELSAFSNCSGLWEHTAGTIENSPQIQNVRIAALFHDIAKPYCPADENKTGNFPAHAQIGADMTASILRRLKFDVKTINTVRVLVLYHEYDISESPVSVKLLLNKLGKENLYMLLELKKADMLSRGGGDVSRTEKIENIKRITDEIIAEGQCYRLDGLAVNGSALIAEGFPEGKTIGEILDDCLDKVIQGSLPNNQDSILKYINEKYKRRLFND